jgi:DNA-binding GntR family transcriptional regulator
MEAHEQRRAYGNLKDEAVRHIREQIVAGTLRPGSKVDQDQIADRLGISKAPVREALIELAQKGFIDALPRRGAFVAAVTAEDIEDHYELTAQVMALSVRRAVKNLTAENLAELRRLHEQIRSAADVSEQHALDRRFFSIIARAGRSRRFDAVLGFLGGALEGSLYYAAPDWGAHEAEHRAALLDALERRDSRAASRLAVEHLHGCAQVTVKYLTERGYWDD